MCSHTRRHSNSIAHNITSIQPKTLTSLGYSNYYLLQARRLDNVNKKRHIPVLGEIARNVLCIRPYVQLVTDQIM